MKPLVKFEIAVAAISFGLIFAAGVSKEVAVRSGVEPSTADLVAKAAMLFFFCLFGFSGIGLMLHVFIALQTKIGNGAAPMIRFLASHETGLTLFAWGSLGLGVLIAAPFALQDMGFRMPLGPSRGILRADIGMTIDEVMRGSTIKMKEPRHMGDGSRLGVETMVFEFRIGDSAVRFPQSRYYWIETPRNDARISSMNIGITPRKMPKPQLEAFQRAAQEQLFAANWMPGHYVADSEETVRMWGGKRTTGDGRYWLRGTTVLIFETKRMDEEHRDEPPGSGEYIIDIVLRPKESEQKLVFEKSAWEPAP